ncbi:hypothetical protein BN946_scf185043.g54 [Trametes cinnabarina]|uniref:Uncharacterized protein n=1 Tax=Pycnoporus cinnabarinus TaxID=5643 RepID=A0A060SHX0_PYCCI|nr:hypothetical protein BN946_scf185043.g54 [Trametes cinnabarina]
MTRLTNFCHRPVASLVFPLSPGYHYNTPLPDPISATPCRCSSVFYSAISACATCQGEQVAIVPWTTYAENCSTVYLSQYPENIPQGTSVPAWAYIDVSCRSSSGFKRSPTSGTTLSTPLDVTPTGINSPGFTADGSNSLSASKKSINIGAIVSGVVGGVVVLLAIGLTVCFALRHKRNAARNAPTGPLDLTAGEYGKYEKPTGSDIVAAEPLASPKIYDPDDPITFPISADAQASSSHGFATFPNPVQSHASTVPYDCPTAAAHHSYVHASVSPRHTGVPEL